MRMRNASKFNPIEMAGKLEDDAVRLAETRTKTLEHLVETLSTYRRNCELNRRTYDAITPKAEIVSSGIHWKTLNRLVKMLEAEIAARHCSCGAPVPTAGMSCAEHSEDFANYEAITRAALRDARGDQTGVDELRSLLTL